MVVGSLAAQISDSESCIFFKYFNQSRNREWGKEDKGVELLSMVEVGAGCIGGIPRFHVGWQ